MSKGFLGLIFGLFIIFHAEASMISFYIVETGLPEHIGRNNHSIQWENAFMDAFFDAGYIVSNYPMLRLANKPSEGILQASGFNIFEARDAGIDYILIAQIDFTSALHPPGGISFYVFTTILHEVIYERHFTGLYNRSEKETSDDMNVIIRDLVIFITKL